MSSNPLIGCSRTIASTSSDLAAGRHSLSLAAVSGASLAWPRRSCAAYVFVTPRREASSSYDRPAESLASRRRRVRSAVSCAEWLE